MSKLTLSIETFCNTEAQSKKKKKTFGEHTQFRQVVDTVGVRNVSELYYPRLRKHRCTTEVFKKDIPPGFHRGSLRNEQDLQK